MTKLTCDRCKGDYQLKMYNDGIIYMDGRPAETLCPSCAKQGPLPKEDELLVRDDLEVKEEPTGWYIKQVQARMVVHSGVVERYDLHGVNEERNDPIHHLTLYKYPYGGEMCEDCDDDSDELCVVCWGTGTVGGWRGPRSFAAVQAGVDVTTPNIVEDRVAFRFKTSRNVHVACGDLILDNDSGDRWEVTNVHSLGKYPEAIFVETKSIPSNDPAASFPLKTRAEEIEESLNERR